MLELDVAAYSDGTSAEPVALPKDLSTVSKDGFLRLLTTQLQHQDPLSPTDNTQFISQLAQFQTLENQLASNDALGEIAALQRSQVALAGLTQAAALVGTDVTWFDGALEIERTGRVDQVSVENGVMTAHVGATKVPLGLITGVGRSPASAVDDAS